MRAETALYDTAALRAIERRVAAALGDDYALMRRAGQAAWRGLLAHWPQAQRIVVACGPGNNGGDGYVLARQAREAGRAVRVLRLPAHAPRSALAQRACDAYVAAGGEVTSFNDAIGDADLIVDAVFGIGLARVPEADAAALFTAINAARVPVFALDVPSGVDAERGAVPGAAVTATRTLEFIARKRGLATGAALDHVGTLSLATLDVAGLPAEGSLADSSPAGGMPADSTPADDAMPAANAQRWQPDLLAHWLPRRRRDSHKGVHGRVLCVGGDHGGGGAIALCAEAALRCGAGLVEVATRGMHVAALLARRPEAMAHAIEGDADIAAFDAGIAQASVVAIGPGLGRGAWAQTLLSRALASGKPLVLDADALNLVAEQTLALPAGSIVTPHPGEAARLLGCDAATVQADRYAAADALCHQLDAVVVLKGAGTIVASPHAAPRVIAAGNPGMAVGGMGDVLCGVIAALCAQGLAPFDAAAVGALLHAAAGDRAAASDGERGLLPSDLMPWLRRLANPKDTTWT